MTIIQDEKLRIIKSFKVWKQGNENKLKMSYKDTDTWGFKNKKKENEYRGFNI